MTLVHLRILLITDSLAGELPIIYNISKLYLTLSKSPGFFIQFVKKCRDSFIIYLVCNNLCVYNTHWLVISTVHSYFRRIFINTSIQYLNLIYLTFGNDSRSTFTNLKLEKQPDQIITANLCLLILGARPISL